ncbi:MAG: DUF1080 domain-containing protein [Saprospiraceae bacterium]|nr:DUF1080 domain-containing protein [Saprospiraceae bacterium]
MKFRYPFSLLFILLVLICCTTGKEPGYISLFDGHTFTGWQGDTLKTWRIIDNALAGGSLSDTVPHNDFLCTTQSFGNFILKLKFKLEGTVGFINAGVQIRSQRATDPSYEMIGYQADMGENYYGALYDESRRNKVLAGPDSATSASIVKLGDWNEYEIRAEGQRIQLFLNGRQTVDYTEPDLTLPKDGLIGLQIHGGGKAQVSYKDILIRTIQ